MRVTDRFGVQEPGLVKKAMIPLLGIPMQALFGQLLIGLINGSFYAMLSLGLAVIFGLLNIANFTHGAQYMLGAMAAWLLMNFLGLNYWWALILAPLIVGAIGFVMERAFLKQIYKLDHVYGMLLTFGLSLMIEGAFTQIYGSSGMPYPAPQALTGGQNLGFMFLPNYRGWVILASIVICFGTWFTIERTSLGAKLRAATENAAITQALGINVPRLISFTYAGGVALAGLAGVMAAPIYQVAPQMGANIIIVVFAVVVIGGMGSILGSIMAGFSLGLIEGLTKVFYPEASNTVIFVVMALVLLVGQGRLFQAGLGIVGTGIVVALLKHFVPAIPNEVIFFVLIALAAGYMFGKLKPVLISLAVVIVAQIAGYAAGPKASLFVMLALAAMGMILWPYEQQTESGVHMSSAAPAWRGNMIPKWVMPVVMLIIGIALPYLVYPVFVMKALCFAIFACAYNLLAGYAGLFSFGHAAFFGMSAYFAAHAAKEWGFPPELCIIGGGVVGALMGVLFGRLSLRRQGIYFAMITLALAQMVYFFCVQAPFTGGENGIQGVPRGKMFSLLDLNDTMTIYFVILGVFMICFLIIWRVINSPFGQVLKAIRDNEPRTISLGYKPDRYKLLAFVLSATLCGVAGACEAIVFQLASLTNVEFIISGDVLLMTLVGGLGTLLGPVVGAFVLVAMESYLAQFGSWVTIIQGSIFLICVMAFRAGIVGEVIKFLQRRDDRNKARAAEGALPSSV